MKNLRYRELTRLVKNRTEIWTWFASFLAENSSNLFFHSSGAYRSKIKVLAGLVPTGSFEGESVPCFSPSFLWFPTILGIPGFAEVLLLYLCLHMAFSPVSVSVSVFSSYKDTSHTGNPVWPPVNLVTSSKMYFQIRSLSQVSGVRTSIHPFLGDKMQPTTGTFGLSQGLGVQLAFRVGARGANHMTPSYEATL